MIRKITLSALTLAVSLSFALTLSLSRPAHAAKTEGQKVEKVLKALMTTIRMGKFDLAGKQLATDEMASRLMADDWKNLNAAEQKEMADGLATIMHKLSFPKGKDIFKHLDGILFEPTKIEGKVAHCLSTIIIHRNYKKSEIKIEWALIQQSGKWRVFDTIMLGESTLEGIREDQIEILMEEGGKAAVLKALRTKVKELK